MKSWRLHELLGLETPAHGDDPIIRGLATDSREVRPGGLFLACRGTESHGLAYLDQAIERGAVAVAWEPSTLYPHMACSLPSLPVANLSRQVGSIAARFYGHPSRDLFALGVTGTDGKTSCTHMFAQMAQALGHRCGVLGTIGFGFLDALAPATHTTPDPVALQAWLARLAEEGADCLAMEVSSHALDQGRIRGVELDAAIFTNLSRDHLDYHGDLDNYARAKRRLLDTPELKALIINADDDYGARWIAEFAKRRPVVAYAIDREPACAQWLRAVDIEKSAQGLAFALRTPDAEYQVRSGLLGHFNIYNLLAVTAAWLAAGEALPRIVAAIGQIHTVPGRIEPFRAEGKPLVVVDYAHTPGALSQVLRAVAEHRPSGGRIICVFGCGGDRDRGKRPQMAAVAAELADQLILTDDNPRSESPQDIIADMLAGLPPGRAYQVIHDRATAIDRAIAMAAAEDVVLIAGKGHEDYQQIGRDKRPFSDRKQVARVLGQEALSCSA